MKWSTVSKFGLAIWICLLASLATQGQEIQLGPLQQRIDRLIAEGKFERAEFDCRERLSLPKLSLKYRAAITNELLRVFRRKTLALPANERGDVWSQADAVGAEYLRIDTKSPQQFLVRLHLAMMPKTRAWLLIAEGAQGSESESIASDLRLAAKSLSELADDLENEMRRTACLLYTSPSPRDQRGSRMPSSA